MVVAGRDRTGRISTRVAELQSCRVAELQSCRVAELQSYRVAELQSCEVAELRSACALSEASGLHSYKVAKRQSDNGSAGRDRTGRISTRGARVAELQSCEVAELRSVCALIEASGLHIYKVAKWQSDNGSGRS